MTTIAAAAALATCMPALAQVMPTDPLQLPARLPAQQAIPDPFAGKLLEADAFAKASEGVRTPSAAAVKILKRVSPEYPYLLVRKGEDTDNPQFTPMRDKGSAEISVLVGTDGKPRLVSIRKASRDSFGLNSAEAALQWEFEPLVENGAPVEFQVVIPFVFRPVDEPVAAPPAPPPGAPPAEQPPPAPVQVPADPDLIRLPVP